MSTVDIMADGIPAPGKTGAFKTAVNRRSAPELVARDVLRGARGVEHRLAHPPPVGQPPEVPVALRQRLQNSGQQAFWWPQASQRE